MNEKKTTQMSAISDNQPVRWRTCDEYSEFTQETAMAMMKANRTREKKKYKLRQVESYGRSLRTKPVGNESFAREL